MINAFSISGLLAADSQQLSIRLVVMVLHSLWQGAAIGILLAIVLWVIRPDASRIRYASACIAFFSLPLLATGTFCVVDISLARSDIVQSHQLVDSRSPEDSLPHSSRHSSIPAGNQHFQQDGPGARSKASGITNPLPAHQKDELVGISSSNGNLLTAIRPLAPWLSVLYLSGVVLMLLRTFAAIRSGHRLQQSASPIQDADLRAVVANLTATHGLKIAPMVACCQQIAVPVVVGVLKPTILLPASLVTRLAPDDLIAILGHELAHIRRYDLIVNLLQRIVESLLFFHPVVWWISRQVSNERENCCDDLAMAAGVDRLQYASALLRMAELCLPLRGRYFSSRLIAVSSAGTSSSQFSRRIERLLEMHGTPQLAISKILSVSCAFAVVLTGATVGVLAQKRRDTDQSNHVVDSITNVEVQLDSMTKTVDLNLEGRTEVEFKLPDREETQARKPDSLLNFELPFVIKFEQGKTSFLKDDKITILEVRGTAETFSTGNIYWIKGTYALSSCERATLAAYITAADAKDAKSATLKVQTTRVHEGNGTFTLFLPMTSPGWPHVSFYPVDGGESFGGNYFGTGDSVLTAPLQKSVIPFSNQ